MLTLRALALTQSIIAGTAGSDSPGQAVEAEEIVKQLDMEQVDEIITSTAVSANGASYASQTAQVRTTISTVLEEVDDVADCDLPPLTGKEKAFLFL